MAAKFAPLALLLCFSPVAARLGGASLFSDLLNFDPTPALPPDEKPVPGQFVVKFDDRLKDEDIESKASEVARQSGGSVKYIYRHCMKGAVITNIPDEFSTDSRNRGSSILKRDDVVDFIPDHEMRSSADLPVHSQSNPPRGLDRIDQSSLPLNNEYHYAYDGTGVTIYIFDTGINAEHSEFIGRQPICGMNVFQSPTDEPDCFDNAGHGSHVSGTAAGTTYGVAKNATLVSVKVLDDRGGGSFGGVIAGLDWVMGERLNNTDTPMVINMSLGGSGANYMDEAVEAAVDAGIVVVVAAGNENVYACTQSPGRSDSAITVGASEQSFFFRRDKRARYSNKGKCVDLFAPGTDIESANSAELHGSKLMTGTSMSAPHVSGAAALYLQRNPEMSPRDIRDALVNDATRGGVIWLFRGWKSPDRLLNTSPII